MPWRRLPSALFLSLVLVLRVRAEDAEWLIVPGRSIGQISLGMDQTEVFRRLGTPHLQNDFAATDRHATSSGNREIPVAEGVTQNDWITSHAVPSSGVNEALNKQFMCDFVTVYVRAHKVVQIEIRSPRFHTADGLSIANTGKEWLERYPGTEEFGCKWNHPSSGGIPATKHFALFEDAVKSGVAWRNTAFGNLAPDPDPGSPVETVLVHAPGEKALVDPDGASRFIWKEYPYDGH